jgi:hypothetical protein
MGRRCVEDREINHGFTPAEREERIKSSLAHAGLAASPTST